MRPSQSAMAMSTMARYEHMMRAITCNAAFSASGGDAGMHEDVRTANVISSSPATTAHLCEAMSAYEKGAVSFNACQRHASQAVNVTSDKVAISACKEQQWEQEFAPLCKIRETSMTANAIIWKAAISVCERGGQ